MAISFIDIASHARSGRNLSLYIYLLQKVTSMLQKVTSMLQYCMLCYGNMVLSGKETDILETFWKQLFPNSGINIYVNEIICKVNLYLA